MERRNHYLGSTPNLAVRRLALAVGGTLSTAAGTYSQAQGTSPWENAVNVLQTSFTGPIAKGLGLVAIVIGGLTFAFAPLRPTSVSPSTLSFTSSADQDADLCPKSLKSTDTTRMRIFSTTPRFSRKENPRS